MCILQIRGERPFLSKKFDIEGHKNYKFLSDFDSNHHLDVKEFLDKTNNTNISKAEMSKDDWNVISHEVLSIKTSKGTSANGNSNKNTKNSNKKENV
jgi:hypothetical protein